MTREMITDPAVFFVKGCGRCDRFDTPECSTKRWAEGLAALRAICLEEGLEEHAKWGHPTYMHAGRNIAIFGAFRGDFRLTFMNATLLSDSESILKPAGPNSAVSGTLFLSDNAAVAPLAPTIRAYLRQLMDHAEKGTTPPKVERALEMPEELIDALDADPELAEAFHTLTPGRQKSYVINLNAAKQSATRVSRIEKFRDKILAGKGAMER